MSVIKNIMLLGLQTAKAAEEATIKTATTELRLKPDCGYVELRKMSQLEKAIFITVEDFAEIARAFIKDYDAAPGTMSDEKLKAREPRRFLATLVPDDGRIFEKTAPKSAGRLWPLEAREGLQGSTDLIEVVEVIK